MTENHRASYVALVAALRSEFAPTALGALRIQLEEHRYDTGSVGVLAQAVRDAVKATDAATATEGDPLAQILRRLEAVEKKLAGVIENHSLWDGS